MIPAAAVEAAAKVLADCIGTGANNWEWHVDDARALLEAAAPYMIASPVFTERMVDAVLDHSGTPRRKLFEYPYRDDDSRDIIKRAELLVQHILALNNEGEK